MPKIHDICAFIVSLTVLCFSCSIASKHLNGFSDESALLSLKESITEDPYGILTHNWTVNTSMCNWYGVYCGIRHRRVIALDLRGLGLVGMIPPGMGNLSFLSFLNISHNNFHGSLPFQLGHLRRLKVMSMRVNDISGEIPSSLGMLQALQHLDIGHNNLTGTIPLAIFNISSLEIMILTHNGLTGSLPDNLCNVTKSLREIILPNNYLTGNIPINLGSCGNLQILVLAYNSLTGKIPKSIGELPMLEELYLYSNQLTGNIPRTLFNVSSLWMMSLFTNRLTGELPRDICDNLPEVEVLSVGENQLGGPIPSNISSCRRLQVSDFSSNAFSGQIPEGIGMLPIIRKLDLYDNHLTVPRIIQNLKLLSFANNSLIGTITSSMFNLSMLEMLYLGVNNLTGELPDNFGDLLPNIQILLLGANTLTGSIPSSLSNATKLSRVALEFNQFIGPVPEMFGKLHQLEGLHLEGNYLTIESATAGANFFRSLANCKRLRELQLGANPLKIVLPSSVGNLSRFLEEFYMPYCEIHGRIANEIGNLTSLRNLDISNNNLIGSVPGTLGRLLKIQELYLSNNRLRGSIPIDLCQARNMGNLFLSENRLSGPVPNCLGNMTSLRDVRLDNNQLSSSIPVELCDVRDLIHLDISSNNLHGSLPIGIENFQIAVFIHLSDNKLSGSIPSTISGLKELCDFSLAGNMLQGSIPTTFDQLRSLQFLDLSQNELSGNIPKGLEGLSYLEYFNVSFNRLEGEIPSGGPFANFSTASFMGNPALCGMPRLQVPPCPKFSERKQKQSWILKLILPVLGFGLLLLISTFVMMRSNRKRSNTPIQEGSHIINNMRRISYFELLAATNHFGESNFIGAGAFGSVYRAVLSDGIEVAVKVFNMPIREAFQSFDAECEILKNIKHKNLVQIISSCSNLDFKALVFKYMKIGSLDKLLHASDHHLSFIQRLSIMIDVASAIEYLHHGYSTPVVHRDLKPSNVLLDEDMDGHLSDFGLARLLDHDQSTILSNNLATIGYMAPEYGSGGIVSTKADVYSYGILLMETFSGKSPTDAMFEADMSLKQWIHDECCSGGSLINVIDPKLLNDDGGDWPSFKEQCFRWVMELALSCTVEVPHNRNNMTEVAARLKNIRKQFLASIKRAGVWR